MELTNKTQLLERFWAYLYDDRNLPDEKIKNKVINDFLKKEELVISTIQPAKRNENSEPTNY